MTHTLRRSLICILTAALSATANSQHQNNEQRFEFILPGVMGVPLVVPRSFDEIDRRTRDALDQALQDERTARAFYEAIIAKHGQRRPFSRIVQAERRHEAALLRVYKRYHLEVPPDMTPLISFEVPDTFGGACRAAVESEEKNIAMYDRFLRFVRQPDIARVMRTLRAASKERHVPAFRRHAR